MGPASEVDCTQADRARLNASDEEKGGRCEEGKHEMKKGKGGSRRREASVSHSIHHALVQRRALSKPAVEADGPGGARQRLLGRKRTEEEEEVRYHRKETCQPHLVGSCGLT